MGAFLEAASARYETRRSLESAQQGVRGVFKRIAAKTRRTLSRNTALAEGLVLIFRRLALSAAELRTMVCHGTSWPTREEPASSCKVPHDGS